MSYEIEKLERQRDRLAILLHQTTKYTAKLIRIQNLFRIDNLDEIYEEGYSPNVPTHEASPVVSESIKLLKELGYIKALT